MLQLKVLYEEKNEITSMEYDSPKYLVKKQLFWRMDGWSNLCDV